MKSGILTLSDKGARGERTDTSGPLIEKMLIQAGAEVEIYRIIADNKELIHKTLITWVDELGLDLIITTGGTGVSPTDVTPEATKDVLDKEIPGISEAMRAASMTKTPNAMLSRGISGTRGHCLIINLPGSEKAARENLEAVLPVLGHAVYKIKGGSKDCGG